MPPGHARQQQRGALLARHAAAGAAVGARCALLAYLPCNHRSSAWDGEQRGWTPPDARAHFLTGPKGSATARVARPPPLLSSPRPTSEQLALVSHPGPRAAQRRWPNQSLTEGRRPGPAPAQATHQRHGQRRGSAGEEKRIRRPGAAGGPSQQRANSQQPAKAEEAAPGARTQTRRRLSDPSNHWCHEGQCTGAGSEKKRPR